MSEDQKVEIEIEDVAEEVTADETVEIDEGQEVTEPESLDSVEKAMKAGPAQAAVPGGTQNKGDQKPRTKAGMLNAMYQKMHGMKKDELKASYNKMFGESTDIDGEEVSEETAPAIQVTVDLGEEMAALADTEATLSEGFKEKAAVIFEAALSQKVSAKVAEIQENLSEEKEAEVAAISENMVEKVDGFLNYVVERYMEDNKLAIEAGIRSELAENFMVGLKNLFTESYVEVPESKVDMVDDLAEQVAELEGRLNESMESSIAMTAELEEYKRNAVIAEHSNGLAATEVEKLAGLVEGIEFDDEDSFSSKVAIIVETHFGDKVVVESVEEEAIEQDNTSPAMKAYLEVMARQSSAGY